MLLFSNNTVFEKMANHGRTGRGAGGGRQPPQFSQKY